MSVEYPLKLKPAEGGKHKVCLAVLYQYCTSTVTAVADGRKGRLSWCDTYQHNSGKCQWRIKNRSSRVYNTHDTPSTGAADFNTQTQVFTQQIWSCFGQLPTALSEASKPNKARWARTGSSCFAIRHHEYKHHTAAALRIIVKGVNYVLQQVYSYYIQQYSSWIHCHYHSSISQ